MFTWICPQCGRECPPAYTECPDCSARQGGQAAAEPARPAAAAVEPAPAQSPPEPLTSKPRPAPRSASPGMPTWLLSIVFALAFFGVGAGIYLIAQHFRGKSAASEAAAPAVAPGGLEVPKPVSAAPATLQQYPYLKYLEITGWRLLQNAQKRAEIRFVVVNHSAAEIPDLSATVNLRAQAGQEAAPIGSFAFKLPSLGPYESRDLTAPLNTNLKVYEFPDWQNLFEEIQVNPQSR